MQRVPNHAGNFRVTSRSRRSILLGLSLLSLAPALARGAEPDPIEVVTAIYRRAAAGKGESGGQFLWLAAKDRRTHFTSRTANLWERADRATAPGDMGPVSFDPVTVSQDPDLKSYDLKLESDGPDRARILVTLTGHGQAKPYASVRYFLQQENGRWLIDDIASARGTGPDAWSVRKLLQAHLTAAGRRP
jgi:hypothetical protein